LLRKRIFRDLEGFFLGLWGGVFGSLMLMFLGWETSNFLIKGVTAFYSYIGFLWLYGFFVCYYMGLYGIIFEGLIIVEVFLF